jgi:hypothetical protein
VTLQAILDCAHALFCHYNENQRVWSDIRSNCEGLLCAEALTRYQELCEGEVFNRDGDDDRRADWESLIDTCNSDDEEINIDAYERQISLQNNFEDKSDDVRDKLIAYDQLRAWLLYVEHKPVKMATYRKFLVSICFLCMQCNIVVTIVSHYSILQVHYSHEATANRVPGHAAGGTPGRLVSTPVLENVEVAAAARGGGGDDDDNDDNNDNNYDNDNEDGDDKRKQKLSCGGVKLVPRAERRRSHRGMARVTTIIGGDRKRKATGEPV